MIKKLLIANRGEIALRIMHTAKRLGIQTVGIYSATDSGSMHTKYADESYLVLGQTASESYLNISEIIALAKQTRSNAIHPGYGYLSENPDFAQTVVDNQIIFVGPAPKKMRLLGGKDSARELAKKSKIAVCPGYDGIIQDNSKLIAEANIIGFPILIKAAAGGGGRGMRLVYAANELESALAAAKREAKRSFGDDRLILEKFIHPARHIEVQVLGDKQGKVIHLFERDCSAQRRYQKIIEEAPACNLKPQVRDKLFKAAVKLATAARLDNLATVEFLVPLKEQRSTEEDFYFIEANPRIQVEHPVTEMITGLDLIELQLNIASGKPLDFEQADIKQQGVAIEARIYAEIPKKGFIPSVGKLTTWRTDPDHKLNSIRVDHALELGNAITSDYDPMLAKVISLAKDRRLAIFNLQRSLEEFLIHGVDTNKVFLNNILRHSTFLRGEVSTRFVDQNLDHLTESTEINQFTVYALCFYLLYKNNWEGKNNPFRSYPYWRLNGDLNYREVFDPIRTYQLISGDLDAPAILSAQTIGILNTPFTFLFKIGTDQFQTELVKQELNSSESFFTAKINGIRFEALVSQDKDLKKETYISIANFTFLIKPNTNTKGNAALSQNTTNIVSCPLPGSIIEIKVKVGQKIQPGDILIILDSMKIEHSVTAIQSGIVETITIDRGMKVAQGDPLITLKSLG